MSLEPGVVPFRAVEKEGGGLTGGVGVADHRSMGQPSGQPELGAVDPRNRHPVEHRWDPTRLDQPRADRGPRLVKRADLPNPFAKTSNSLRDDFVRCSLPSSVGYT